MDQVGEEQRLVAEFQEKFETPTDPEFWLKLVDEEITEAEQALAEVLKELVDVLYVTGGLLNVVDRSTAQELLAPYEGRVERIQDVLSDLAQGDLDILIPAFQRVHASNMSKLDDSGHVIRREDGKVLKGPNYQPPNLLDLVTG